MSKCISFVSIRAIASALVLTSAVLLAPARATAQTPPSVIDIVSIDVSGLPEGTPLAIVNGIRNAFYDAERFWESRLIGFSPQLPVLIQRTQRPVQFVAVIEEIDGPGGILGFAGPSSLTELTASRPYTLSASADMTFDNQDAVPFYLLGLFDDIVRHEMAHGLGFGTLFAANRLNLGPFGNYTGSFALKQFRIEAKRPNALFVPLDGGGGHWEAAGPFFFNADTISGDLMIPFITDFPVVNETTWAVFADLWFKVKGINDGIPGSRPGSGTRPRRTPRTTS
jgi:hypothetical protein